VCLYSLLLIPETVEMRLRALPDPASEYTFQLVIASLPSEAGAPQVIVISVLVATPGTFWARLVGAPGTVFEFGVTQAPYPAIQSVVVGQAAPDPT